MGSKDIVGSKKTLDQSGWVAWALLRGFLTFMLPKKENKLILGCDIFKDMPKSRITVIPNETWSKSKTSRFWGAVFPKTYPNQALL